MNSKYQNIKCPYTNGWGKTNKYGHIRTVYSKDILSFGVFDDGAGNPSCAVRKHLHFLLFILSAQLLLSSVTIRRVSYVSRNSISGSHFSVRDHWVDIHSSHLLVCSATRMKGENINVKRCESSGSRTSETHIQMGLVLCCFCPFGEKPDQLELCMWDCHLYI